MQLAHRLAIASILGSLAACGGGGGGDGGGTDGGGGSTDGDALPAPDPCMACGSDEVCVQRYGGICDGPYTTCVARTVDCSDHVCTAECQTAYCGGSASPYQCIDSTSCGGESPNAFTCYGY